MLNTEQLVHILNQKNTAVGLAGVVGAAVGATSTYFILKKKLEKTYAETLEKEIQKTKEFYAKVHKTDVETGEVLTPEQIFEGRHGRDALEALRTYQGEPEGDIQIETLEEGAGEEEIVVSVFSEGGLTDIDYDAEERDPDKPYVISFEEFNEGEEGYEQSSLTYFEGDDTLASEDDSPIADADAIVGDDNLSKFGHGSNDHNVVYIRNENLETDYEVVRSKGKYSQEVLGYVEPSERPGLRKFRGSDE